MTDNNLDESEIDPKMAEKNFLSQITLHRAYTEGLANNEEIGEELFDEEELDFLEEQKEISEQFFDWNGEKPELDKEKFEETYEEKDPVELVDMARNFGELNEELRTLDYNLTERGKGIRLNSLKESQVQEIVQQAYEQHNIATRNDIREVVNEGLDNVTVEADTDYEKMKKEIAEAVGREMPDQIDSPDQIPETLSPEDLPDDYPTINEIRAAVDQSLEENGYDRTSEPSGDFGDDRNDTYGEGFANYADSEEKSRRGFIRDAGIALAALSSTTAAGGVIYHLLEEDDQGNTVEPTPTDTDVPATDTPTDSNTVTSTQTDTATTTSTAESSYRNKLGDCYSPRVESYLEDEGVEPGDITDVEQDPSGNLYVETTGSDYNFDYKCGE